MSARRLASSEAPSEEYAEKRKEIRDNARDIFARHGYRKTSIEEIGKACGLGKAALYHYFSSKEEIFAEVVRAEGEKVLAKIRAAYTANDDPKAQLTAVLKTTFTAASELIDHKSAAELTMTLPLAAEARRWFFDEEVAIVSKILEDGRRRGLFKESRSPYVPFILISGLSGVVFSRLEVKDQPPIEDAIDSLADLFLEGICR